jgi:hypothetical protein
MSIVILADGRMQVDKAPIASLRYGFDVAPVLAEGDSVSAVTIEAQSGITAASPGYVGSKVFARVTVGTAGAIGSMTLRWTTTQGDTDARTIYFNVKPR